jgi:hypothetical protein
MSQKINSVDHYGKVDMDLILRAVRNKLTGDSTLTVMVPANDITMGYNAEVANYPCILLGINAGGAGIQIAGVTKATLTVDVYSNAGKRELWNIYNRIKAIIHNNEIGITDAYRIVHAIHEVTVDESGFDRSHRVWRLTAKYNILYGILGLSVTTGASGTIYADRSLVSADPSKEVAKFRGQVNLNISFEHEFRHSQDRFGKAVYYKSGAVKLTISEIMFRASILDLIWNVETKTDRKLNNAVTLATTYQLNQNSCPAYLQVLFQMVKTDDGKKLEIEASKAVCNSLMIPFSKRDFSVFDCEWILLGDNNDNVVRVSIEN